MNTEELLQSKNIYYKTSGADFVIRCLNPEHEDRNPSLRIDKLTGNCNCFSCNFSGNIFKFYDITRNDLDILAVSVKAKIKEKNKPKLYIPLGAEKFEKEYRGISKETFMKFGAFTYASDKELEDRLIFPVYDLSDEISFFSARRMFSDVKPKYYNYPSGVKKDFFPASPVIHNGSVIIVEGIFDVLNLFDKGLKNVVSSLGLTQISKDGKNLDRIIEKYSLLKLQGVNTVYIMYDGDTAGEQAAKKLLPVLKKLFIADIIELPEDLDPGDMTKEQVEGLRGQLYEDSNN